MTATLRYRPPQSAAIGCWAVGVVLFVCALWFWMGTPSLPWYENYLLHSNIWLLGLVFGGALIGMPLYWLLALRGRLKQVH